MKEAETSGELNTAETTKDDKTRKVKLGTRHGR